MTACIIWDGYRTKDGYGRRRFSGRMWLIHRLSYCWATGEDPGPLSVLHKCDNPPCFNWEHLFLGDQAANVADMIVKGRHVASPGSGNGNAKLHESDVELLREAISCGAYQWEVAELFGISVTHVGNIFNRKSWK